MSDDLRKALDPVAKLLAARARFRDVPESQWMPPPTAEVPNPTPVVTPAHREIYVPSDNLPAGVVRPDGGTDLGALVAMIAAAVARLSGDRELRGVHGSKTFTSTLIWAAGDVRDVPVTWDSPPLAPCRLALPRLDVGVAWQGKLSASVKAGSVTDTGCTVVVSASASVVITLGTPLTVHADGIYEYFPPFSGGAT